MPTCTRPARATFAIDEHRPHHGIANARPVAPVIRPDSLDCLSIHQRDRLSGIHHEYEHAA
jgi:hypothetical protein